MIKFRAIFLPLLTLAICYFTIRQWTLGFNAFTVFSHTLEEADPLNKEFPKIQLINQDSLIFNLKDSPKYKLVNFVYLSCPTVCHKVNNQLESIYQLLDSSEIPEKIEFTTISFDLKKDNVKKLRNYRNLYGDSITGWTFALPYLTNEEELNSFLKEIGIWIYKASKNGIINHSTTMYLLDENNKIIRTFDPFREDEYAITKLIQQCLYKENTLVSL